MDIINIKFDQAEAEIGSLGMQGENKKVALHIDCSSVLEKHPGAAILVNYDPRLPGEPYFNLPVTALENGIYEAVLTPMELACDGLKRIQVRAVEGDYEDRSKTFIAYVEKSVYDFRPPAGPVSDWLDQLRDAIAKADAAQQHGPVIGKNGNWYVWKDGAYVDTGVAAGSDISPEQIGEAVSDYLQQNPFQETDPTVPAWAKQPEKPRYTAQEVGAQPAGNYLTAEEDPTVPAWAKAESKPTYTAAEVGALPSSTKIPSALSDLTADATHRTVTDAEKAAWNGKSDFSGSYNDLTDKPAIPDAYTLPIASESVLGGVKPISKTDDMTQGVGVDSEGKLWALPGGGGGGNDFELIQSYTLAEDVSVITIECDAKELAIRFKGRINNAEDTASNANTNGYNFINGTRVATGHMYFTRPAGTVFNTIHHIMSYGNTITGTVAVLSNPSGYGQFSHYGGLVEAQSINNVELRLVNNTDLFKAGSIVEVYGR